MKKTLSLLLMLAMIASLLIVPSSAADNKLYKTYDAAAKGDLLWIVDFNAKEMIDAQPNDNAQKNMTYTIGDDGRSVTVKGVSGATDKKTNYWGGVINGLKADAKSQYTMTYKVRANGKSGTNNSTGIGGWLYDSTDASAYNTQFMGNYGNWNSINADGSDLKNRACLSVAASKKANGGTYLNVVDEAVADADGFITCRIDFDGVGMEYKAYYLGKDGKWLEDTENFWIMEKLNDTPDDICFMLYSYYLAVDTTVKDVKYFKGIGLSAEQLAAEAPKPVETTAAPTTTAAPVTTAAPTTTAPATTPATADASMLVLAVAAMALTMTLALRKREN